MQIFVQDHDNGENYFLRNPIKRRATTFPVQNRLQCVCMCTCLYFRKDLLKVRKRQINSYVDQSTDKGFNLFLFTRSTFQK